MGEKRQNREAHFGTDSAVLVLVVLVVLVLVLVLVLVIVIVIVIVIVAVIGFGNVVNEVATGIATSPIIRDVLRRRACLVRVQ